MIDLSQTFLLYYIIIIYYYITFLFGSRWPFFYSAVWQIFDITYAPHVSTPNIIHLFYDRILMTHDMICLHWLTSCRVVFACVRVQMVSSLFLKYSESASQQRSNMQRSSTARRYQANTVSAKFQSSLQELLERMERLVK